MSAQRSTQGGWLLVGLIVIISSVLVAMGGIALALAESRRTVSLRENDTEAVYLAQAGVMQALLGVRTGGGVTLQPYDVENPFGGPPGPSDPVDMFILGGTWADFLLVNLRSPNWNRVSFCGQSNRDRFENWRIWNTLTSPVTIDKMRIWWSPNNDERILRIELGNTQVWTAAPGCTGVAIGPLGYAEIDFPNVTVPALPTRPNSWNTNRITFNTRHHEMQTKNLIELTFIMTDGSTRVAHYDRLNPSLRTADVTIKSVGEVRKGSFPFVTWRRLQADYRMSGNALRNPGRILAYQELTTKAP